jgi:hypothetical protein
LTSNFSPAPTSELASSVASPVAAVVVVADEATVVAEAATVVAGALVVVVAASVVGAEVAGDVVVVVASADWLVTPSDDEHAETRPTTANAPTVPILAQRSTLRPLPRTPSLHR